MNWRHPLKELPADGQDIFFIEYHWSLRVPGSFRINGGTFRRGAHYDYVCNDDDMGEGCQYWPWPTHALDCSYLGAWVPAVEINLPDFLLKEEE